MAVTVIKLEPFGKEYTSCGLHSLFSSIMLAISLARRLYFVFLVGSCPMCQLVCLNLSREMSFNVHSKNYAQYGSAN